jgi:sterol 3beta-glucosyltransferase
LQCPTTIIPFFGDQPFWGERVSEKGVGPPPIPVSHVTLDKLISAIEFMLDPEVKRKAVELAREMENEDGVEGAVCAFHKHIQKHLPDITHVGKTPSSLQRGFFHDFLSSRRHRFLQRFFHKLHIKFH